ncbi:hypothetical protein BC940DRAFT_319615 [Gongronella butleri]|nr:hypothetical protein BC940DRAFT_319615 [Gongronella butleri]
MIGPFIPDHLRKQKEEENNQDEIQISDDEDDNSGSHTPPRPPIAGPTLPTTQNDKNDDSDDEDSFMPALPPDLAAERQTAPPAPPAGPRRRVMGPARPPPGPMPAPAASAAHQNDDDDDDDTVGPSLPGAYDAEKAALSSAIADIEARARQGDPSNSKPKDDGKVKRDEWMLLPPEVNYLAEATSGRSRQFKARSVDTERDTSSWTDTPADKERKAKQAAQGGAPDAPKPRRTRPAGPSAEELAKRNKIDQYNKSERPVSLLEMHRKGGSNKRKETRDDPTKRAFDRDLDLAGARPMNKKQKNEFLQKSGEWSQRFGHGGSSFL